MSSLRSPYTLPAITSIIGLGALSTGIYSCFRPISSAANYGIPITAIEQTSESSLPVTQAKPESFTPGQRVHLTFVHAYAIRNLGMGASVIALSYFYVSQSFPMLVRKCLGIVLLCGSLTPVGDAVITRGMGQDFGSRPAITHASKIFVWAGAGLGCLW